LIVLGEDISEVFDICLRSLPHFVKFVLYSVLLCVMNVQRDITLQQSWRLYWKKKKIS